MLLQHHPSSTDPPGCVPSPGRASPTAPAASWACGPHLRPMASKAAHHEFTTIKRSEGRSATARIAYICRTAIEDERTGETHRYRDRKQELVGIQLVGSDGDAASFANALEAGEKRKDGQVGRSSILALPNELDDIAGLRVVRAYQEHLLHRYGCASLSAVHRQAGNHHAHIVESTHDGEGKKIDVLSNSRKSGAEVEHRRGTWAEIVNAKLERSAPSAEYLDHRRKKRRRAAGDTSAETPDVPHHGPALHAVLRRKHQPKKQPAWAVRRFRELHELLESSKAFRRAAALVRRLEASAAEKSADFFRPASPEPNSDVADGGHMPPLGAWTPPEDKKADSDFDRAERQLRQEGAAGQDARPPQRQLLASRRKRTRFPGPR